MKISKVYELLVDSLRKLGELADALDAIVSGFVADAERSSWTYAAWARIMSRLKTDNSHSQKMRCVVWHI